MKRLTALLLCGLLGLSGCAVQEIESVVVDSTDVLEPQEEELVIEQEEQTSPLEMVESFYFDDFTSERTETITHVMLHFSSDVIANPDDPYNMDRIFDIFTQAEVSTHYFIDRDGMIYQCVDEELAAWHAGVGTWADDEQYTNRMNQYAIGIELLAIGTYEEMSIYMTEEEYNALDPADIGYTDAQYDALNLLLADILDRNPDITYDRDHIIGHDEYSEAKNDPGELFDWSMLGF